MGARGRVQLDAFVPVAAFLVCEGAVNENSGLFVIKISQLENARTRYQRLDDFKIWILSRRTDKSHGSSLDVWQERVLLSLVPAMDLIHKKDRANIMKPATFQRLSNDHAQI